MCTPNATKVTDAVAQWLGTDPAGLADLAERSVLVPETVETVASGAAVQAAAILAGVEPEGVARAWGLGGGTVVDPRRDRRRSAPIVLETSGVSKCGCLRQAGRVRRCHPVLRV